MMKHNALIMATALLKVIQMPIGAEAQNECSDFDEKYIRHLMNKITWII